MQRAQHVLRCVMLEPRRADRKAPGPGVTMPNLIYQVWDGNASRYLREYRAGGWSKRPLVAFHWSIDSPGPKVSPAIMPTASRRVLRKRHAIRLPFSGRSY